MGDLNCFMEEQGLSHEVRREARCDFRTRHSQGNLKNWGPILQRMSPDLRQRIAQEMHKSWAATSDYFKHAPPVFIYKVSALFEVQAFPVGENIIEIGQEVNHLYVLTKGIVLCNGRLCAGSKDSNIVLGEDALFGTHGFSGARRSTSVALAMTYCCTYTIKYHELLELLEEFPAFRDFVKHQAMRKAFRSHVLAYACAYRLLSGLPMLNMIVEVPMVEHYLWKLRMLMKHETDAPFATVIQKHWRGYQARGVHDARSSRQKGLRSRDRLEW